MAWQGAGHASRQGLSTRQPAAEGYGQGISTRPAQEGYVQIHIDKGFDFDNAVDGLRAHVRKIKEVSQAIETEQRQQGELINTLDDTMARAKLALRHASQRLNIAYRQAKSNHLLFLVLFVVALVLFVYTMARMYRLGRFLVG